MSKRDHEEATDAEPSSPASSKKPKGKTHYSTEELIKMPCHGNTTKTAWMAMYELFRVITLKELGATVGEMLLKLFGSIIGDLAKDWWPNTLAELEKSLDFKGVAHFYRTEHFCPCCGNRFFPALEESDKKKYVDQICQRTDCKGRRFKKLLDDKGVVSKAEPLQQCFYYRLGRFFDKSEADESAMQALRKETLLRTFSVRLRIGMWQCVHDDTDTVLSSIFK